MHTKKFGICQNCGVKEGKYRCPRCHAISCSLACCNEHKFKTNCSGIKDKIDFLPLTKMNGNSIRKDMRFLSNLSSKIHISSREPLLHLHQDRQTNNRFHSLCSAAKSKQIRLFLQPQMMAKHQNNQTFVTKHNNQKNNKIIHWTLSIQFGSHQFLLHDVNENDNFLSILRTIKMQKFEKLDSTNTQISKIKHQQNGLFEDNDIEMNGMTEENVLFDEYEKYLNDINLIRLPCPKPKAKTTKKDRMNGMNSQQIARCVIAESVLLNVWNIVSVKDEQKVSVVMRIPNHFMFVRINPNQSVLAILRQKIINEYPEFMVLRAEEIEKNGYVVIDYFERQQFANLIRHNTKIHQQKKKLKVEMEDKLNAKKLFNRNDRNAKNRYRNNGNRNGRSHHHHHGNGNGFDKSKERDNGMKAKDLFNGTIGNKRNLNQINNGNGQQQPAMKRMRYEHNGNTQTFTNPFTMNNNQQPSNGANWYMYM